VNARHGGALAPFASHPDCSRGRRHAEPDSPGRNAFQRDRDRIVHSTAFRRLVYKTQVFLNHEGDLFRTRMTHSLEVAQIARSIARSLGLHEDLVEAIALAHDVGHTPFGHAGQDALNDCLLKIRPDREGFEHNFQSLRVVDLLEARYPEFDGLNLTFETREGVLKHCSQANARRLEAAEPAGVGQRFLARTQPSLEAQLCKLADEIAYNAHDIDDGVRSGLIELAQVQQVPLFGRFSEQAARTNADLVDKPRRWLYETVRLMLSSQIYDLMDSTQAAIAQAAPTDVQAVRNCPPLVQFSPTMQQETAQLKAFLFDSLYRHPRVLETMDKARQVVSDLFAAYVNDPAAMQAGADPVAPQTQSYRRVADYIAGMTDRFASREHQRLTGRVFFA
jgi:dGTPase